MNLTDKDITKYQQIYKEYYGREISKDEAYEQGTSLLRLMELVYTPVKKADYDKIEEERAKKLKQQ